MTEQQVGSSVSVVQLSDCPECGYSLEGLPASYRCPECGFPFDDTTFVLTGIPRGIRGISAGRRVGWLAVAAAASFGPSCVVFGLRFGGGSSSIAMSLAATAFVVMVVYLVLTSKSEKRGMQKILFASGGFGQCVDTKNSGREMVNLTRWQPGHVISTERKSARWMRLQIGSRRHGYMSEVDFDALVHCDIESEAEVVRILNERIEAAAIADE